MFGRYSQKTYFVRKLPSLSIRPLRMIVSSSGLLPARKSSKFKEKQKAANKLEFQMCIKPAPMSIKPLSSLVNPFKSGCSIFCNHPTNNIGLKMAIEKTKRRRLDEEREAELIGEILEDILCRRGLDKESMNSTPEAFFVHPPRPHLVLNLRRTVSQETGRTSVGLQSTFSPSPTSITGQMIKNGASPSPGLQLEPIVDSKSDLDEDEGEVMKRRGKLRKKKGRKGAKPSDKGEKEVVDLSEPRETLVSTFDGDQGDYYEAEELGEDRSTKAFSKDASQPTPPLLHSNVFDMRTLRHLRRNLSTIHVHAEFRNIWRRVLEEALDASPILPKDEVKIIDEIPQPEPENWISYPRLFSRSSARFDLPINKKLLNDLRPLQYLKNYVAISKANMVLFDYTFGKYKDKDELLTPQALMVAIGEVMGRPLTEEERKEFEDLIDLEESSIDYRSWLGVSAIAERFYGEKFSTGKDMDMGKRQIIEKVDFESLQRRINKLKLNPKMLRLIAVISTS